MRLVGAIIPALTLLTLPQPAAGDIGATSNGFSEIAGCISGADNVLVSIVVDESASLRQTDPTALRVQGITTAIDSLEQLTSTIDGATTVEVSMSTFARSYSTLVDWQELTPRAAQKMRATAERTLPARDAGNATDYRQALLGAKGQLDARQREIQDPQACKLLLWFTDGALDVDAETATAERELCQVGGIADAVRQDGIAVVALALFRPGGGVTQPQRDQLRAVAEGTGGADTCGKWPVPSDSSSGVYLPADDPAALQRLFAGAGALVAGGTELAGASCPGPGCRRGAYHLAIDAGVAGARVLVQSINTPRVAITTPSGRRLTIASGGTERADGATVSYLVRDHLATVNIAFDPYTSSRSQWIVRPSSPSELSVYWFWGAQLAAETSEIRAGANTELTFQLQDQNGDPLTPDLYRGTQATIRVGTQDVRARVTPDGLVKGTFRQGVDEVPSKLSVSASLSVRSAPGNVRLGPITISDPIPVSLPPAYPTVSPKQLNFGHLEGVGKSTAELQLTGSQMGPTEVCLVDSQVTVPGEGAAAGLVKPSSKCAKLQAGETRNLQLSLTPHQSAEGIATGDVTLRMTAADGSDDLELAVPLQLEMARHVDESTRWALIVALLLLALLVPAILLVGSNLLLARFVMTSTSRTASKTVRVTPSGLERLDGRPLLDAEDFENAGFSGSRRGGRLPIAGTGITLKARRIFSFKEPQGIAVGPQGHLLVSSTMPYRTARLIEAPVGLGVVDTTVVVMSPTGATPTEAEGTLVMVVPHEVDRQGIKDRASRISSAPDWGKLLAELSDAPAHSAKTVHQPATGSAAHAPGDSPAIDDAAPPLPWDDGPGNSKESQPGPAAKPRFGNRSKPKDHASSHSPSNTRAEDDSLPPLPDFLK